MDRNFEQDIPLDMAEAAHRGTSFVPERRGEQERSSYATTLAQDLENLERYATTDEKRKTLEGEFARYRQGYAQRVRAYLATRSRAVSWMIAGPSRFPARRQEKIHNVERKRLDDALEFRKSALDNIRKALQPELRPVMTGDQDAQDRLKAKLEKLEKVQERMKAANAALRKAAKDGPEAQVAAMVATGLREDQARKLLEPDFLGRLGFPDYELKNTGAEIRRLKGRLKAVEALATQPVTETAGDNGVKVEDNPQENRVRLFFPGKPEDAVRDELKAHAFRWTPTLGCWQAYRNHRSLTFARAVAARTNPLLRFAAGPEAGPL